MKKVILVAAVAMIALVSCKKDRNCTCTETATGIYTGSLTTDTTFTSSSKNDAEALCAGLNESYSSPNQSYKKECELK